VASSSDVSFVIDNIEMDYAEKGWDDTVIADRLDSGSIPERVRMKALADEWDAKAALVETPIPADTRGRLGSFPIKRV
jgi:hypothetical protein